MLSIKKDVELRPYGPGSLLTSESEVSQEVLKHLSDRYPEDIEGEYEEPTEDKKPAPQRLTKAQLLAMVEKVEAKTATPEEIALVEKAKLDGKI